jgi:hypothetical protein
MPNSLNDIGNEAPAYGGAGIVDNCIVQSQVVSGNADFFSASNLNLTLIANATDPFEVSVAGKRVKLVANVVFAVTDTAHNFIFIDQTGALSRVATPPTYAFTAPAGPASGDMWFDLGKNQMKTWNGAAWVASNKVMIGYVRADAAAINARYVCMPIGAYPLWLYNSYGDGSDGFLDVSAGTTTIDTVKRYTAVVVRSTGAIVHSSGGGTTAFPPVIYAPMVALIGTVGMDLNGLGRPGSNGAITTPSAPVGTGIGGSGGGGGGGTNAGSAGAPFNRTTILASGTSSAGAAGTALGGAGGAGTASPYPAGGLKSPMSWTIGNGGGGGGGDGAVAGGNGGAGGGGFHVICAVMAIGASAFFRGDGTAGVAGSAAARGGGGGGGGGVVIAVCRNFFNSGTFTALAGNAGGSGGAGAGAGGAGGAGVAKRIAA